MSGDYGEVAFMKDESLNGSLVISSVKRPATAADWRANKKKVSKLIGYCEEKLLNPDLPTDREQEITI